MAETSASAFERERRWLVFLLLGIAAPLLMVLVVIWITTISNGDGFLEFVASLEDTFHKLASSPCDALRVVGSLLLPFVALGFARLDIVPKVRFGAPWPSRALLPLAFASGVLPMGAVLLLEGADLLSNLGSVIAAGLAGVGAALGLNAGRALEEHLLAWWERRLRRDG